jgi:arsenate reductase
MEKKTVLFLCTGNSARSQMAEALLRKHGGSRYEVHSAGLEPSVINPYAVRALDVAGIDASGQYSKSLDTYIGKKSFDFLITVCSSADEKCPVFPGMGKRLHWPFEDPAAFSGSDEDKAQKFREIRDLIESRIIDWLRDFDHNLDAKEH